MKQVLFRYEPPIAGVREVGLAGNFNSWTILEMWEVGGVFCLKLDLEPGRYRYKFIADGVWVTDPANPEREPDPFGGENSVLHVSDERVRGLSWKDVWQDPGKLEQRPDTYLELVRNSADWFELRFHWYSALPGSIVAFIDGEQYDLKRIGALGSREIWHCLFHSAKPVVKLMIRINAGDRCLFLGGKGFSLHPSELGDISLDLESLPVFSVPEWVSSGVVYQIFPDRFYNGDPALNPDFSEWYYKDSRTPPPEGEYLPPQREYFHLVEDWKDISGLTQSPWQEKGKPDWWSFYGGDIPGIIEKLDYLMDLGVNILYLNPIWQAKSNHKYDAADFSKIDPHFGTEKDMKELVKEAHRRSMKIIVDVAFNHTGETFWAFRDCVEKGPASAYWNWYDWVKWPLPKPLPADFDPRQYYQCWWGIKDMPDLNYDLSRPHPAENYVRDIEKAQPNTSLIKHLEDCVSWWLRDIGIDGFRLDVPEEVPFWFWEHFRCLVKSLNPAAWIVGEIWQSAKAWVGPKYFDSVMNYAHFKDPVISFFIQRKISKEQFCETIESGLAEYPGLASHAMMNLLGSHDTWRIHELAAGNPFGLRLALIFQMTFVGAPHVYYGDEIGMQGKKDPDNRRPFDWDWEQRPEAVEMRSLYRDLIHLRLASPVLQRGSFSFLPVGRGIVAYARELEGESMVVALNPGNTASQITLNRDYIFLKTFGAIQRNMDAVLLPANSALIACLGKTGKAR